MLTIEASAIGVTEADVPFQRSPTIKNSFITSRALADELGVTPSKISVYKKLIIRLRHPFFREYQSRKLLNKRQANLLRQCRIWLDEGERGDSLKRKLLEYPHAQPSDIEQTVEQSVNQVCSYCEENHLIDSDQMPGFLSYLRTVFTASITTYGPSHV